MRRTAALLAALLTLLASAYAASPAGATPTPRAGCAPAGDLATQLAAAQAVFSGVVTTATPARSGGAVVHEVTVDRIYKGDLVTADVRVRTATDRCGLGELAPDGRYVFLVTADGDAWLASDGSGTQPASDGLVAQVTATLGAGTAPGGASPQPAEVSFEQVAPLDPAPFLRVAAPGLALVIVGALGLTAARRLGRGA